MATLLVVDDEKLARFTLRKILERAGHRVIEASNGADALRRFREEPCEAVITDIIMPENEGVEMTVELKRDFPNVPVIAVSGGARTRNLDFLKLAKQSGADSVLAKPFSPEELLHTLDSVLARRAPN